MNPLNYTPAQIRKVLVFVATTATEVVALGLLDGTAEKVVLAGLAVLGSFGIFAVKNAAA